MEHKPCVKCGQPGTLSGVDPKKAVYCKQCFINAVKHKFASSIGKRRIFKDGKPRQAIVVYEGDQQSAFLLSLVSQGLSAENNKRLTIEPTVIYFASRSDTLTVTHVVVLVSRTDDEALNEVVPSVSKFQDVLKARWLFVHIASVLEPVNFGDVKGVVGLHLVKKWTDVLSSCSDPSVRLELTILLRDLLLVRIAHFLSIDKILMPDCADVLARRSFSSLCFARAASVACITGAVDDRFEGVVIVRPLRDICLKEIAILNRFEGSDSYLILKEPGHSRADLEKSVQSVTTDFFYTQLCEGFKGVLNTVLSTSSKLKLPDGCESRCCLCSSKFQSSKSEKLCYACCLVADEFSERSVIEEILLLRN